MSRYNRLVPAVHREMIRRHHHPKPNWFVGAAEQPAVPMDPELRREIDELKSELRGDATKHASSERAAAEDERATAPGPPAQRVRPA